MNDQYKPKRPLSAYNLYYRFKRVKTIALSDASREDIISLVKTAPGLEDLPPDAAEKCDIYRDHALNELRRRNIRKDMEHNLLPRDTRDRSHRMNHKAINGAMSFLELGKLMNISWQETDEFSKVVFRELADEGRELYRQRMKKYNALTKLPMNEAMKDMKKYSSNVSSSDKMEVNERSGRNSAILAWKDGASCLPSAANVLSNSKRVLPPHENDFLHNARSYRSPSFFNQGLSFRDHHILRMATIIQGNAVPPPMVMCKASREINPSAHVRPTIPTTEPGHLRIKPNLFHRTNESMEGALQARVKELESQLAQERLRARVVQLENDLARKRAAENLLRAELESLSRNRRHSSGAMAAEVANQHRQSLPSVQEDGLISLVTARGMLPPTSVHEESAMLSRMVHSNCHHHNIMMDTTVNHAPPNKKARCE